FEQIDGNTAFGPGSLFAVELDVSGKAASAAHDNFIGAIGHQRSELGGTVSDKNIGQAVFIRDVLSPVVTGNACNRNGIFHAVFLNAPVHAFGGDPVDNPQIGDRIKCGEFLF